MSWTATDKGRDRAIAAVKKHHQASFIDQLRDWFKTHTRYALPTGSSEKRLYHAVFVLTGYLGDASLIESLVACWRSLPAFDAADEDERREGREALLAPAFWAILRLWDENTPDFNRALATNSIDEMLALWAALPDKSSDSGMSRRSRVFSSLDMVFPQGLPSHGVRYLIEATPRFPKLKTGLTLLLAKVNLPEALEWSVREAAILRTAGTPTFLLGDLVRNWDGRYEHRHLSPASRERLCELWQDANNSDLERRIALDLWSLNQGESVLADLRAIGEDSPLWEEAVRQRAWRRDGTVAESLIPLLRGDFKWMWSARRVWSEALRPPIEGWIHRAESTLTPDEIYRRDNNLSHLLIAISPAQAENILVTHWKPLKTKKRMIQTALYVGTSACLDLADQALRNLSPEDKPFEFVNQHFDLLIGEEEVQIRRGEILRFLQNILPYVHLIPDDDHWHLVDACQRIDAMKWGQQHLAPHLINAKRERYFPDEADRRAEFDECLQRYTDALPNSAISICIRSLLFKFRRRRESHHSAVQLALQWFEETPTPERFMVTLECVAQAGKRKDWERLRQAVSALEPAWQSSPTPLGKLQVARHRVWRRSLD